VTLCRNIDVTVRFMPSWGGGVILIQLWCLIIAGLGRAGGFLLAFPRSQVETTPLHQSRGF